MEPTAIDSVKTLHTFHQRHRHQAVGSDEAHMRRLARQQQQQHEQYHRCSTSFSSSPAAAEILHSCSRGADATRPSLGGHHPGRRRPRPDGEHSKAERLPSCGAGRGRSSSSSSRRNRRREGSGLAAISVVLFASSSTAAGAAVVPAAGPELPPSGMAGERVSLQGAHGRAAGTNTNHAAFVSSAKAAGLEPVRRWAAAECRRLAGATHHGATAAAAAVTAGVTRRTTSFLRGGLRSGGGGNAGASSGGGGQRLRMISGGFSGEFTPPDEPWKRRRAQQQKQQQQGEEGDTAAPQSDAGGRFEHAAGDTGEEEEEGEGEEEEEEEEEVYSWTPNQNGGQGSWDTRRSAILGAAEPGPVWQVDLKRGVYTGDVKIKQVCR